jgi:hypothetical protein
LTDADYSIAWIIFGENEINGEWIGLSDQRCALVKDQRLLGFSVKLDGAPLARSSTQITS